MALAFVITQGANVTRTARISYDSEFDEYLVKFYVRGVRKEHADYFTPDKCDALDTAKYWCNQMDTVIVEETGEEIFL
jgi:hypothetical protein